MPPPRRSRIIALGIAAVLILVGAILVLRSARASDLSLSRVKRAGVVVVGLDPSYPPFEVVNGEGQLDGYDVELARELARRLGVQARLVTIDFGGIYDALDVGRFDLILGSVSPLPEYETTVRYTVPYYDDGLVVVANRDTPGNLIGIESGSDADLQLDRVRSVVTGFSFQRFDDQEQIQNAVTRRTLRGAIVDSVTARRWARQSSELSVESTLITSVPFAIAARRGDVALLGAVDRVLQSMIDDGFTRSLERKWL